MDIFEEYKNWIREVIGNIDQTMFDFLMHREFVWIMPMDSNRFDDGISLRYCFGAEKRIPQTVIASQLDIFPCTMLEMIVALSIKMEEIMANDEIGNRTGLWFDQMVDNLGLTKLRGSDFTNGTADRIIDIFLNRKYSSDGSGGLFKTQDPRIDQRKIEIWYQMNHYLNSIIYDVERINKNEKF